MVAPSYNCSVENVSLPILNLDALFYYSAAGYAVLFLKRWKEKIHLPGKNLVCHSYSLLAYPMVSWKTWSNFTFYTGPYCSDPFTGSAYFLQYFKRNTLQTSHFYSKNSFFLYAIHFPWARFFNKAGAVLFKGNQGAAAVFFLTMPFLILGISKVLGELLKHTVPGIYEILSGGRGQ